MKYIIAIDQSTQGTKALLFDDSGKLLCREDAQHRQIIDENGWVEHDPEEIYANTLRVVRNLVEKSEIEKKDISGVGITNQRETAMCWYRGGKPAYNAIVWQCSRGKAICERIERENSGFAELVSKKTGIRFSPYFSAAKIAWVLENVPEAAKAAQSGELCAGTMDSFLVYRLSGGKSFKTDYSNASRTQLFNITSLKWDDEICRVFNIPVSVLPEVCASDSLFGETDFEGFLENPVPIHGVLGDSHAALFGQGCTEIGMIKATYGTGSSIMMNIGEEPVFSEKGAVTSLAWCIGGKINYVLEGNINYSGAVLSWLKNDLKLINKAHEADILAEEANPADTTYLVPAFTGLGAPYWNSGAKAALSGMTRVTGKAEFCRAALDCIAYQINDILDVMKADSGLEIKELRVDGGPTKSDYLMRFQSDISNISVAVPDAEELSGIGAAYAAGLGLEIYDHEKLKENLKRKTYNPQMEEDLRKNKKSGWKNAVAFVLKS